MKTFPCPYLKGEVELTDERETHIAETHPDLLPEYLPQIRQTLEDPDEVRRSVRMSGRGCSTAGSIMFETESM